MLKMFTEPIKHRVPLRTEDHSSPKQNQEKRVGDEKPCHRWQLAKSGFAARQAMWNEEGGEETKGGGVRVRST